MILIKAKVLKLNKSETVKVKASKRAKAHKRKVKGGKRISKPKTPVGMTLQEFKENPIEGFVHDPILDKDDYLARRRGGVTYLSTAWFNLNKKRQQSILWHETGHDIQQHSFDEYNKHFADVLAPYRTEKSKFNPVGFNNPFGGQNNPEEIIADAYRELWAGIFYPDKSPKMYHLLIRTAERAKAIGLPIPDGIIERIKETYKDVKIEPLKPIEQPKKTLRSGVGKIADLPENMRNEVIVLSGLVGMTPESVKTDIEKMINAIIEYEPDLISQLEKKDIIKKLSSGKFELNISGKELIDWTNSVKESESVKKSEKTKTLKLKKSETILFKKGETATVKTHLRKGKKVKAHKRKVKGSTKPEVEPEVIEKSRIAPDNLVELKPLYEGGKEVVGGIHEEETFIGKFKDKSSCLHKTMMPGDIAGETGTYQTTKTIGWDVIPETIQADYGKGEGSSQHWVDGLEPAGEDNYNFGTPLKEVHLNDLSKIFILDMINGNFDRHNGNIIIDKNDHVYGIDNECWGRKNNAELHMESLDEFCKEGHGFPTPMMGVMNDSFGDDPALYQNFKRHIINNLGMMLNKKEDIMNQWQQYDKKDVKAFMGAMPASEGIKNIKGNIEYLEKYYKESRK